MKSIRNEIVNRLCYTDLVYSRINQKLTSELPKDKIEELILSIINETEESDFQQKGKNTYITNEARNVRVTINRNTFIIITVDRLK